MSNSSTCDVLMLEAPLGPLQRAGLAPGGAPATAAPPQLTAGLPKPSGPGGAQPPQPAPAVGEGKQAAASAMGAAGPVSTSRSEDSTSQSIMHTGGTRRAVSPGGLTRTRPQEVS